MMHANYWSFFFIIVFFLATKVILLGLNVATKTK